MITRLHGILEDVNDAAAFIRCGHVTYEVLVPAAIAPELAVLVGQELTLHTRQYLEGQGQGSSFVPRLIGFQSESQRAFFELFTTVKGLGNRKALRALQWPHEKIAAAIADRDIAMLKSLPEIGKRTAETIIAELNGKVDQFIEAKPMDASGEPLSESAAAIVDDAVTVLTQLGESKTDAIALIDRARAADPELDDAQQLITAALRLRGV